MSPVDQFFWGAVGAAFMWLLMLLACVIWFGLSVWIDAEETPETHAGLTDDRSAP
jgi:hypothetical protein